MNTTQYRPFVLISTHLYSFIKMSGNDLKELDVMLIVIV